MQEPTADFDRAEEAADLVRGRSAVKPELAVILGSGLGGLVDQLSDPITIDYREIPHWPPAGVTGHAGRLVIGHLDQRPLFVLAGRAHFYEGHDLRTVTFPVRVLARLGVRRLILTNAAGGILTSLTPGSLMVIDDHVNLFGTNPLIGSNDSRFGPRFPDMTEVYSKRLRTMADEIAAEMGIQLAHGVYAGVHGPSYETPAEIRYLRAIGADAVGMSTVPEAITARHLGLEVLGLSCITNFAAGIADQPLRHEEVMETASRSRIEIERLLKGLARRAT